jgi:hypothetical protein
MSNTYTRVVGGTVSATIGGSNEEYLNDASVEPCGDTEALRQLFSDSRYPRSASYRAYVAEQVARSMTVRNESLPGGGQLNGSYQVRGNPIDEAPPAQRELTEHDKRMIELAERHGL